MVLSALSADFCRVVDGAWPPAGCQAPAGGLFFFEVLSMTDLILFWLRWLVDFWNISVFRYFWFIAFFVFIWLFIRRLMHIH